jgi:selenoprotein W-related protein
VAELLESHGPDLAEVRVVPSSGGVFEVEADGEVLFSKKAVGRHAEPGEVLRLVGERLAPG